MTSGHRSGLLSRLLRANPSYDLVLSDRLEACERERLAGMGDFQGFYGLLKPRADPGLPIKAVDCDTALLCLTLREPAPLPRYARDHLGEKALPTLVRLVADSILEVEEDGRWLSGPAARHLLRVGLGGGGGEGARLAELSLEALRWAYTLPVTEPEPLAARLYAYNRLPVTPEWKRRLPSPEAVLSFLGAGAGGRWEGRLARGWLLASRAPAWIRFTSRRQARGRNPGAGQATYKLYLSPEPQELAAGFGAILEAFEEIGAVHFKIGNDAGGLLRPDKMVAYFEEHDHLLAAATTLASGCSGMREHGVPFTSEIALGGLLSWGVDPPPAPGQDRGESWRSWLTRRLARALLAARTAADEEKDGAEPWRYALDRLTLEGIDTETWMPRSLRWQGA